MEELHYEDHYYWSDRVYRLDPDRPAVESVSFAGASEPQTAGGSRRHQEGVVCLDDRRAGGEWEKAVDGADGIINLAGEPIAGKRWSKEQKEKLRASRIDATRALVNAIAKAKVKPKFLVNASAVGYYGPHGDETLTESSAAPDRIFYPGSASEWEDGGKKGRSARRQSRCWCEPASCSAKVRER